MIQSTFGTQERYYCIHCNWIGFTPVKQDSFNVCPKCEWVCYPESKIADDYPAYGVYKILLKKYAKVHRLDYEKDLEAYNEMIREKYKTQDSEPFTPLFE